MAEEGDAERLVVYLEARIRDFEKNMAKASGTATRDYGNMRKQSGSATRQMEQDMVRSTSRINQALASTSTKIGGLGKSMIAGFAGGLVAGGIAGLVSQVGQVASAVASVGDEARRAGVDVEAFQELKYVAEQNRIGVDSLTDGLKELNLRADEFIVTKGGAAAEAFQRLGYDAETLKEKLADPSALFTEIIGKLGQLDKAAQIRVADEIFGGTGGEKFVQLIGQGEQGIRDTIQQARDLGIVMSQDLIDKAVDLDQKFNAVSTTVGTALKTAIVEAANALDIFLEQFRSIEERTHVRPLQNQLAGLYNQRELLESEQKKLATGLQIPLISDHAMKSTRDHLASINAEIEALASRIGELQGEGTTPPPIKPTSTPTVPGSGAPIKRDKAAEEADREAKAVQNLIAGLEFERSLIGLSAVDQAKLTALRQAGASATDTQRQKISMLVEATHRESEAAKLAADQMQALSDIGVDAAQSLADAFSDGKIEASELLSILVDVAQQLINMPLGGGGGGNWLSNLLGMGASFMGGSSGAAPLQLGYQKGIPGFATGTRSAPGGLAKINEAGGEIVDLPRGARVYPHDVSMAMANAIGAAKSEPASSFTFAPTIDARGADQSVVDRLTAVVARQGAEFEGRVRKIVSSRGKNGW